MSELFQNARGATHPIPLALALMVSALVGVPAQAEPGRSTNIAITPDDSRLINLNHDTGSVTVFQINAGGTGQNALKKLAEIVVGGEPECVAINPNSSEAYVTNADGFVSVISLQGVDAHTVVAKIPVRNEPRGCALTPSGNILYVANLTHGSVSVIGTASRSEIGNTGINTFNRPYAITVTDDNNPGTDDTAERVLVTEFLAEVIPSTAGGKGRAFDTGNRGVVRSFGVGDFTSRNKTNLLPLADAGFTADRTAFCNDGNPPEPFSQAYCPSPLPVNLALTPQGAFPNQLFSAVVRNGSMYVTTIAAAPEPPINNDVNVQALVYAFNASSPPTDTSNAVNLNALIKARNTALTLNDTFAGDIVAVDGNQAGDKLIFVSRGGDYALRASVAVNGQISIGGRIPTGHMPTGVAYSRDGARAYTNNEVGRSVSVLRLSNNTVVATNIESSPLPQIGSHDHNSLVGKLVFFTALGVPENGLAKMAIRSIDTQGNRGKQSKDGWSSCASCHPAGLADGVTWVFADGPRQTIPLDTLYNKRITTRDARILNWSAVRGSNTDFNLNSIGVQKGTGFVSDPTTKALVKNHGITEGASEALDDETLWISTIRDLSMPQLTGLAAGKNLFLTNCASCHGGGKWTKSTILYGQNPALISPTQAADTRVTVNAGQIVSFTCPTSALLATLTYLDDVGTFDPANPLEIRANASAAIGSIGFNAPSLNGVNFDGPYFHDGSSETLQGTAGVFGRHKLPSGLTINQTITSGSDRTNLANFLKSIDGRTDIVRSAADNCRGIPN